MLRAPSLDDFRRRSCQDRNRRRNAFGFQFESEEGRRFQEEMRNLKNVDSYMADLYSKPEQANRTMKSMFREVHYFSELTDEEIYDYFYKKQHFLHGSFIKEDFFAMELYLLEIANLSINPSATEALEKLFDDYAKIKALHCPGPDHRERNESSNFDLFEDYFLRLCQSFLISHPPMAKDLCHKLMEHDLYWKLDPLGAILSGHYQHADDFLKKYAKGIKEETPSHKKPYIEASWSSMPYIFAQLDAAFPQEKGNIFQQLFTVKSEVKYPIDLLPVSKMAMGQKRRIVLSQSCFLDYKMAYGNQAREEWERTCMTLREGAQEFLATIHLYADSILREKCGGPRRKRNASKVLKKKYARSGENPRIIQIIKETLMDPRFEEAIKNGISLYIKEHPFKGKETEKNRLYAMDHEQLQAGSNIDLQQYQQAKKEANEILSLLHDGQINYQ